MKKYYSYVCYKGHVYIVKGEYNDDCYILDSRYKYDQPVIAKKVLCMPVFFNQDLGTFISAPN